MNKYKEEFIEKTLEGLSEKINYGRVGIRGFEFDNSALGKECVLVIGLNPAGYEIAADKEKKNRTYLYSLSDKNINSSYVYNNYYRPIYTLMNDIFNNEVKWHWCNKDWKNLREEIENSEDNVFLDIIHEEYIKHKEKRITIYVGDMFYYHETNSRKLPLKGEYDYQSYCRDMLKLHIDFLTGSDKTIKFIYINNSQVSKWLCGDFLKTIDNFENIPVFYGGMISGGKMDAFSKKRLVNEIRSYLKKGN